MAALLRRESTLLATPRFSQIFDCPLSLD